MLRTLYQPYKWLVYIPLFGLMTAFLAALCIAVCTFAPRYAGRWLPPLWARFNVLLTPATVEVRGRDNILPGASYIICANHLSHFDIFLLYGWLPLDLKWVMKKELRKVPFIGQACAAMGHIFLDRQNRQAAIATLRDYQHHMHPGDSILFFPEGTRSRDGHMHEFRKGAFVMARDLNLPILPISLIGTDTVLPNQTMNLFPGRMTMIIHPPVAADVVARTRSEDLLQLCRDTIAAPLPTRNKPLQETTA